MPAALTPKNWDDDIREAVLQPVFQDEDIRPDERTRIFVNPDGAFLVGGPSVHSGLTGRKNAIDTYGEYSRHSGSALSGKDPSRIDRNGAYVARYAAKNVVAAGLATACEVQLSYSIGLSRPVSIQVETFGTGKLPDQKIATSLETVDRLPAGGDHQTIQSSFFAFHRQGWILSQTRSVRPDGENGHRTAMGVD